MPREIHLSTAHAEYDGTINLTFQDEAKNTVRRVEGVDVIATWEDVNRSLNADEQDGTKFLQAVRRYIFVKYDVSVSAVTAGIFYDTLVKLLAEAEDFFTNTLDSSVSTESSGLPSGPPPSIEHTSN